MKLKPDFESAIAFSTFISEELPEALRKLADYIEANPQTKDYDSDMKISTSYNSQRDKWHVSYMSAYSIDKKIIKLIK